jgi:hypothetical protein
MQVPEIMDKLYWTVKFISVFTDFFLTVLLISMCYFMLVHMRDLKDEMRRLRETILERRRNG